MPVRNRFTIYDVMEAKGIFEANPANAGARNHDGTSLYVGPVAFPKMLYHPKGETRVTVPAEIITTPMGPKAVGEQRELVSQVAENPAEEKALLDQGWHRHPAAALQAAGKSVPATGAEQQIQDLERRLASLMAEKAALESQQPRSLTEGAAKSAAGIGGEMKPPEQKPSSPLSRGI